MPGDNDRGLWSESTEVDWVETEDQARKAAVDAAVRQMDAVAGEDDVTVRDLLPAEDFGSGADNGWNGDDREWVQSNLTADAVNEVYEIDNRGKAQNKVIVIYGVSNLSADPSTTELELATGSGGTIDKAQIESMLLDDEVRGLLTNPYFFGVNEAATLKQYVTDTSDELVYHGVVAEQDGNTLEASDRFLRSVSPGAGGA